jgi:RNA methyltransferase, TrmH family
MIEITSLQHPTVKHLVKLRTNHDYRQEHHALVIEGAKMLAEAAPLFTFKTIITSHPELIPPGAKASETILTTPGVIQKISGLQSAEGILAEIAMPKFSDLKGKKMVVALDRINDPGNLGTILRTGLALGWDGVFLLDDSCDPYNDKALRASRGAIFKLPMGRGSWKDLKKIVEENKLKALVADIDGIPCDKVEQNGNILLVLCNESTGPSKESIANCEAITIPMSGNMESLNVAVAAGILMHTLQKTG